MFPGIDPADVPAVLCDLVEYSKLCAELQRCPDRHCPYAREVRAQWLRLQSHLPIKLLQHFHSFLNHPHCGRGKPLATVSTDGLCGGCWGRLPLAWLFPIRQQTVIYICRNCGAILIPANIVT